MLLQLPLIRTNKDIASKQFGNVVHAGHGFCPALSFFKGRVTIRLMKAPLYSGLVLVFCLSACGQKSDAPVASTNSASTASSPANAPAGYLGALMKGQQTAVKTIDTTSIDKAIQLFSVENGRNPKDLNELVDQKFLSKIPETPFGTKLVYDAGSGTVKIEKQ
jgi:hypothetical protein